MLKGPVVVRRESRFRLVAALLGASILSVAAGSAGCASHYGPRPGMTNEDLYRLAESAMLDGKPGRAIPLYERVDTSKDNTLKAQVHLRLADAYFDRGGLLYLAEAQSRYQSFLNFFPLSDQAPYAQYRYAVCLSKQVNKPERDQTPTRRAIDEFRKVEALYPNSSWVTPAHDRIREMENQLASDALIKARFYHRKKAWPAAVSRLKEMLDKYPEFPSRDEVLYLLGTALTASGHEAEGETYLAQLRREFPHSDWTGKAGAAKPAPTAPSPGA
jgi:outer membrane protein assembly factor BamD